MLRASGWISKDCCAFTCVAVECYSTHRTSGQEYPLGLSLSYRWGRWHHRTSLLLERCSSLESEEPTSSRCGNAAAYARVTRVQCVVSSPSHARSHRLQTTSSKSSPAAISPEDQFCAKHAIISPLRYPLIVRTSSKY